jgi:hypothetical protein
MKWISVNKLPSEKGKYLCYVPDCKWYNEHWDFYYFDGENFIDNQAFIGNGRVVPATHYVILEKPE